jgi:hypothetical protein
VEKSKKGEARVEGESESETGKGKGNRNGDLESGEDGKMRRLSI